jgi:hypothetical protein
MAKASASPLIAALRGNGNFDGPTGGAGPTALNFNWGDDVPVGFRRRNRGGALNPQRLTATPGLGYNARRGIGGDRSNRDGSSGVLALPTTITPFPKKEPIVEPDFQMYEPDLGGINLPLPEFALEPEPDQDVAISYEELVDPNPWNAKGAQAELAQQKPEPEVAISYEELVDPNPWNAKGAQAELAQQKPEPEVAISYEELVDPNPWNVQAPPAELEQDPEVAVTVEEIPDVEPSTLRETLSQLIDAPPAELVEEPKGTVTVEEVPDVPVASSGRQGGGYSLDTGLSREMMMLAALAGMIEDPQGQITIEEIQELGF